MRVRSAAMLALLAGPSAADDGIVPYSETDLRMNAAIASAQASLPKFLETALDSNGASRAGYLVKVAFPTESDPASLEHIWVGPFGRLKSGDLTGFLDNDPADLGALEYGDQVSFTATMVSDWTFLSERGLAYGQFTTRVIFEDGAFGDTPFEQLFEADPIPADWQ